MPNNPSDKSQVLINSRYLDVMYSTTRVPIGEYPVLLSRYLMKTSYKKTGKILDIGSGRGDFLTAFSSLNYDVAGVDISPCSIQGSNNYNVKMCNLECEPLPFPENEFDFIFSKSVIEHLHTPQMMISGAFNVLRPGGIAVIMTPSWAHTYWGPFYFDHTHVTPYTIPSLNYILQIVGFENITTRYFYQLPILWKYPSLTPLIRLFSAIPLPYRPYDDVPWPDSFNKLIRFSKEVMLMAVCQKPMDGKT